MGVRVAPISDWPGGWSAAPAESREVQDLPVTLVGAAVDVPLPPLADKPPEVERSCDE